MRFDADRNTGDATKAMKEVIRKLPEIVACHCINISITGTGILKLQAVAHDLHSFSRFALQSLLNLSNVHDMHTRFSLGEVKPILLTLAIPSVLQSDGSIGPQKRPSDWNCKHFRPLALM